MTERRYSAALQARLDDVMASCPLIPVITIDDPAHAAPLADALIAGGIRILEVTLRTLHGLDAIRQLRKQHPDVWVGAGTVVTPEQYRQAEDAGAQFVISPGATAALLEYGLNAKAPYLPGVATLSDVMNAYSLGYRVFKFFPAEVAGGKAALNAFSGPFPDIRFCPTGGIRQETARDYLALKNVVAVGGTWLTPKDAIAAGDWERIRRLAQDSLAALK
jgi:2-dehydro-3-deoxyphosphogluconate aldolase / (4S)-4-hydroxy-2-oxoglutarate aldolase